MSNSGRRLTRRHFLSNSAALAATAAVATTLPPIATAATAGTDFSANWKNALDRVWLGSEFWSNPLQDWRVVDGRIECTNAAVDRNVHVLVRSLGEANGEFDLRVRIGRVDGAPLNRGGGSAGFRIGIRGPLPDYRNALVFGRGLDAGFTAAGGLFIDAPTDAKAGAVKLTASEVELRLRGAPAGADYKLTLLVSDAQGQVLGSIEKTVPATRCAGQMALVNNFPSGGGAAGGGKGGGKAGKAAQQAKKAGANAAVAGAGGLGQFWFADWRIAGAKVQAHPDRTFGPLLFSQYTLSQGVLKMSAQLPPLGAGDAKVVRLQVKAGAGWRTLAEAPIHAEARTAAFRLESWDATKDVPYRLAYALRSRGGKEEEHFWTGTVRRDPVDAERVSVADISCNIHEAFPNTEYVGKVARLNPDLLAFTGDQFYESTGGFGAVRAPTDLAMIDYLRKWYFHGWTWRELMRDRPSVSIPDDHDVYQGNLWGEGGRGRQTTQAAGGYDMPAEWVNVVYRTQTAHHPDPHASGPAERGTLQYYGPMTYGRVSFAILADRQYKSGPEGKVPATGTDRGDHVMDPKFDPKTVDIPGAVLLGEKQEEFLRNWVRDWRGAEMKAIISQTIFTSFPTTHGRENGVLRADYDTNGWPQTPRNRAVRELRRAFAFHIAGDQHIPGVVHYGVDAHRDGGMAFAGPAVNTGYPRWFQPEKAPWLQPKQSGLIGDFTDAFGHPLTVLAVKNGAAQPRQGDVLRFLDDKSSGIGIVTFDKKKRKIRVDCWPLLADVTKASTQFPGWPLEFDVQQNYGRKETGHLPVLKITGAAQPLIEVIEESTKELVYALRVPQPSFRPQVFTAGLHTVRVSDPDTGKSRELRGLKPSNQPQADIQVTV